MQFRPVTLADAEDVADVLNAFAIRFVGQGHDDAVALSRFWTSPPPFDIDADTLVAVAGGRITGYADIGDQGTDGTVLWLDIRGEPQEELHEEMERRARERAAPGAVIKCVAYSVEKDYHAFLARRGFRHISSSYRMYAELDDAPATPVWPDGISVRHAREDEIAVIHAVYCETFSEHEWFVADPLDEFTHHMTGGAYDRELWFVAEDDDDVAGIAICRPHADGNPETGWVSILGVRAPWRRRGLGSALLRHVFETYRQRGLRRVGLGVDAGNSTGAVRLYEEAGMTVGWSYQVWQLTL